MRKLYVVGMVLALMTPLAVMAGPAGAATPIVKCAAPSGSLPISPPLTNTPKIETISINLPVKSCTGSGGVKSGTSTGKSVGTKKTSCSTFFSNPASTNIKDTIKWVPTSKGTSSFTAKTTEKVVGKSIVATVSGKITSGTFKGKTASTQVKVTLVGSCSTKGGLKSIKLTGLKPFTIS